MLPITVEVKSAPCHSGKNSQVLLLRVKKVIDAPCDSGNDHECPLITARKIKVLPVTVGKVMNTPYHSGVGHVDAP